MGALVRAVTASFVRAPKSTPKVIAQEQSSAYVVNNWHGKVGKANVQTFRNWAEHSEWIRGAINIRRTQVSSAEWQIVPFDQTKPYSKREAKRLREFFLTPNPRNDSFRSFIEPVIEDLLVLDAGCVEKVRNLKGEIVEMWPVDGATVRVAADWDGDPEEYRYFWYPDWKERARWKNRDFLYMVSNPRTYSPIGLSNLETLKLTIEAELFGHEYNRRQIAGAAPDGVLDLGENVTRDQVREFRAFFESEIAGKGAIGFIGGSKNPKWMPFRQTARDMQFLEWQIYLVRKIAVVFGLSPQDLGVTFDVNRSTAEIQLQTSEDRGLRPLMALLQDYLTEEIVWDPSFGGSENNLAFRFTALNLKETTAKANINKMALAGVPWKTVNEARIEDGREPLKGPQYDSLLMVTPTGAVSLDQLPTAQDVHEAQARARAGDAERKPKPDSGKSSSYSATGPT